MTVDRFERIVFPGLLFGFRAYYGVFVLGLVLVPDTFSYASGGSAWSSPAFAISGLLGGRTGVSILAVAGAVALGIVVALGPSRHWGVRVVALYAIPFGYVGLCASPDALGAAAVLYGIRARGLILETSAFLAVCVCHLEAGLVLACVFVGRRFGWPLWLTAALAGLGACLGEQHLQARYFLPALAIAATTGWSCG